MQRTTLSRLGHRVMMGGLATGTAVLLAACGTGDNSSDAGSPANEPGTNQGESASAAKWNDADVQFAQMTIPDHQMVAEMATMAEKKATTAELKTVAKQMKAGQTETVQMLTEMLAEWGKPTGGDMAGMQMPGAMTDKDIYMLSSMKKGMEFDMMFAEMMVEHHQASIKMAKDEQANGANADAKEMAADMEKALTAQVTTLQKIADMS